MTAPQAIDRLIGQNVIPARILFPPSRTAAYPSTPLGLYQTLFSWDSRVYDWRDYALHMIFVAQQTVLTRHAAGVTGLAAILFHRTKIGHEILRIAPLVALQIRAVFFKVMAGQTTTILQDTEMRLVHEIRETFLFAL